MRRISSASQFFDNLLSRRRGTQSGVGSPREKFRRFGAAIASLALLATFCSVFAASTASAGTLATGDGMSFLATNGVTVPVGTAINYSVNSAADDYSYTGHGTVTFHAFSTTAVAPRYCRAVSRLTTVSLRVRRLTGLWLTRLSARTRSRSSETMTMTSTVKARATATSPSRRSR